MQAAMPMNETPNSRKNTISEPHAVIIATA